MKNNQNARTELDNGRAFGDTCHSHCEQTPHRNIPKMIFSRHSATKVCPMNSSPTSPVTQHTDQQTNQTNQKHESKIWYWDMASGQDLCENNLHARTWAQILTENHVNITNHSTISSRHCPNAIRRIALQSQHADGLALMNRTYGKHSAKNTCTWKFQLGNREDVPEGWTRNDLATWLSEKGCWMNSSLTSALKQTNIKKTQSVRNMNKPTIMIHFIEQERTTNPHCEDTVALATLSLRSRCREMSQIWFGHAALRQQAIWRNTFGWKTSSTTIWNLIGWTLTPLDQQENVTTPRHFMQQTATEPTEWVERSTGSYCEKHVYLEISLHTHERQLANTLLHLPLPHLKDCTERRNKEDLVTSLCDVSSDATHWPTNKPNEPEARIEHMIFRHSFWSRPLREQPPWKNLSIVNINGFNSEPSKPNTQFKHTHEQTICIVQISHDPSSLENNVVKIGRNEARQKGNLPNTLPKRNPTHYAAITTRWCACTDKQENDSHSKEHLPLPIPTKKHAKHLRGKNQKRPCPVALRKKCVGWTPDAWTETNEHEENEERQKLERNIKRDLEQQLQMKNLIKKKPPLRAEPTWK